MWYFCIMSSFLQLPRKKYLYIYNREGTELHCLKEHGAVLRLQFLENHFLLASVNKFGQLHYQDVTMGAMVGNFRTGLGRTNVMQLNPFDGLLVWVTQVVQLQCGSQPVLLLLSRC